MPMMLPLSCNKIAVADDSSLEAKLTPALLMQQYVQQRRKKKQQV
jgi:hypothetical protein